MFSHFPDFKQWNKNIDLNETVTTFQIKDQEIEIYSSSIPTKEQYAYRHLSVMKKVIAIGGDALIEEIRNLKRSGLKTEPAFAKRLNLKGDPYEAFLNLEDASEAYINSLL